LQLRQQVTGDLFDLHLLSLGQFRFGTGQQVKDRQLVFREVFTRGTELLVIQIAQEFLQTFECLFNVRSCRVVGVDQCFQLFDQVHPHGVAGGHLLSRFARLFPHLFGGRTWRLHERFRQLLEVDRGQIS
jgi:hypothetical protein